MGNREIYKEITEIVNSNREKVLTLWVKQLARDWVKVFNLIGEEAVNKWAKDIEDNLITALPSGEDISAEAYIGIRNVLDKFSYDMNLKNLSPSESASFIFSLKDALLSTLLDTYPVKEKLNSIITAINKLIDKIGLYTFETYVKSREKMIREQQQALMEVSAPVVRASEKILLVPLIGMLDSARTQLILEALLSTIEETESKVAILDISGIPTVDTLVAKHLIQTVSAVRLMGAECIITGISARISQTIVQIGLDLAGLITITSLADGLKLAFDLTGQKVIAK